MNKQIIEQDQVKAHSIKPMCFYMERCNEKKKKNTPRFTVQYVKSVRTQSFIQSIIFQIRAENGELQSRSPYSVQIWENIEQKKLQIRALFTQ